jgi:hypothetical protein
MSSATELFGLERGKNEAAFQKKRRKTLLNRAGGHEISTVQLKTFLLLFSKMKPASSRRYDAVSCHPCFIHASH